VVRGVGRDVDRGAGAGCGRGAAEDELDLAVEAREHLFEVVAVRGRAAAVGDVHVDQAIAAVGPVAGDQHRVGVAGQGDVRRVEGAGDEQVAGGPSRGALALEGYASQVDEALTVPDTGDIERDLTTQLLTYVGLLRDTPAGRVVSELIGASQTDPALAGVLQRTYSGPRRAAGPARLRAARERGQIRPDADPEVLIDQLWGPCCIGG
jgi:hypothetical protein